MGYGPVGATIEMIIGSVFLISGILLLIKGWREVYHARREERLATDGVYGAVRHPQYTGIFLALFGELIHWPTILTLALFPILVWAYVHLARKEEAEMIERFGDRYRQYQQQVPMFFPRMGEWRRLFEAGSSAEK